MRASRWSATTLTHRRAKVREADEERRCKPRSVRASRTRPLATERSRSRWARISRCPIRWTSWTRSVMPAMSAPTSARPATSARATAAASVSRPPARPRRRLRPGALQRARALGRRPRRAHAHARPLRRRAGRPTPGPSSATPADPSASPTPARRRGRSRLDDRRWATLAEGVARAAEHRARGGYEPVFHHHTSSYVEGLPEIERFLEDTEVDLLLDSGHLAVAGGDPIQGLKRLARAGRRRAPQGHAHGRARTRSARSAPT